MLGAGFGIVTLTGVRTQQNKDAFQGKQEQQHINLSKSQVQQTKLVQTPGLYTVTSQIAATHASSGSQAEKPKDSTLGLFGVILFQADP